MLGSKILAPALLVFLFGGCPKRQTTPRVVYVQQAPSVSLPASSTAQAGNETLTIQEPAATPVAESTPTVSAAPPPPAPQSAKKPKNVKPVRDSSEKVTAEVPAPAQDTEAPLQLEPQGSEVQALEIGKHVEDLSAELADLGRRTDLTEDQYRTINDALTFCTQSRNALSQHDLLRANQLAQKADLLIKAVQGKP